MLSLKARLGAVLGVASLTAIAIALPIGPAMASGGGCGSGFDFDSQCTEVDGSGLYIDHVTGHFIESVLDPNWWVAHIEIRGPQGHIKNCATFQSFPGYFGVPVPCTWYPRHTEPGGNYCEIAWGTLNGGRSYTNLDEACVDVHR
jgi:hypothetical protein